MKEEISKHIGGIEYTFPKQYLDLLLDNGLSGNDRFTAKLWVKYLGGFIVEDDTINQKNQELFLKLMKTNFKSLDKLTITIDDTNYIFDKDTQVLNEFKLSFQAMQSEWRTGKKRIFASTNNKFAIPVSQLIGYLENGIHDAGLDFSSPEIRILAYDLLSIAFPSNFNSLLDLKESKTDKNNRKLTRIRKILKRPKVRQLSKPPILILKR